MNINMSNQKPYRPHRQPPKPADLSIYHASKRGGDIEKLMRAIPNDLNLPTVTVDCPIHGNSTWFISSQAAADGDTGCQKCRADRIAMQQNLTAKRDDLLKNVKMPVEHIEASFSHWQLVGDAALKCRMDKIVNFAKGYAATYKRGHANILLTGNTGTGKTKLACLIANEIIRRKYSPRLSIVFKRSADIQNEAKACWDKTTNESEAAYMSRLGRASVLIIDEVGQGDTGFSDKASDKDRGRLSDLIDQRYQAGLPTIFTTNMTADVFYTHIGDRARDRIRQNLVDIPCVWRSYRDAMRNVVTL